MTNLDMRIYLRELAAEIIAMKPAAEETLCRVGFMQGQIAAANILIDRADSIPADLETFALAEIQNV